MESTKRHDGADHNASVEDAGVEEVFTPKLSVLQEAQKIIHGERNKDYGDPALNHGTTAELFNIFLRRKYLIVGGDTRLPNVLNITADDVCWFNIFQKISREAHSPQRDNLVDIAGYVGNIEMMQEVAHPMSGVHPMQSGNYGRSVMEDEQERTLKQNKELNAKLERLKGIKY